MRAQLQVCEEQSAFEHLPVKYRWLRPIKIGNRNESEWAYDSKPYPEFMQLMEQYFENTYRMHNWVYKMQDKERHNCRDRLQPGHVILEFDYAAKATQFQQDAMKCSAARQLSNFILFAHFDPTMDEVGNNISDTTEVFSFHSDCMVQDSQSVRRAVKHVVHNLQDRKHLEEDMCHAWADGSGTQNKGRKAFRNLSELSVELAVRLLQNFPSTAHFDGPWDTEGGRQARIIRNYIRNERDVAKEMSNNNAGDNVALLRKILPNADKPDLPRATEKMWRPMPEVAATTKPCDKEQHESAGPAKPKRQQRGRTDAEFADDDSDPRYRIARRHILRMEPCDCNGVCKCPSDGRLTYKRDPDYDCSHIVGTRSTYCYRFDKKAMRVDLRQFSCYCRWCARCQYDKCSNLNRVRHKPSKPVRPLAAGYRKWRDEGWREVTLTPKSAPDKAVTRVVVQSVEAACTYVSKLRMGATMAVHTKIDGKDHFWLASKQSEVCVAEKNDAAVGVKKGERVLSIIWYDRLTDYKYVKLDDLCLVAVSSVLVTVSNISWQRTTTNRFYLGEHSHNQLMDLVNNLSEL